MSEPPRGSSPVRPSRGRPRDPEADAAILRATLDLFIERGVEGTSIEQIAKHAGVGKLTVYRRWNSKEDLIAAAIESARGDITPPTPIDLGDTPIAELISAVLPTLAATLADPRFRALVARVYGTSSSHPAIMASYWEHYVQPRRTTTRALLRRAQTNGALAKDADLEILMDMMVGAVMYRLSQPGPLDVSDMHRYLESLYRQIGLLPH